MDKLAVSARNAAYIMFEAGLSVELVQIGIDTIRQPVKGYYYPDDVYKYAERAEA